jgi:hypothetical protein
MYRVEGHIFCPRCFDKTEFVPTPEASDGDKYPPIECVECGYTFGKVVQEDPAGGPPKVVPAISEEVRDKARLSHAQAFSHHVARNGYKLRPSDLLALTQKDKKDG